MSNLDLSRQEDLLDTKEPLASGTREVLMLLRTWHARCHETHLQSSDVISRNASFGTLINKKYLVMQMEGQKRKVSQISEMGAHTARAK